MLRLCGTFALSIAVVLALSFSGDGLLFDRADYYVFCSGQGSAAKMYSVKSSNAAGFKKSLKDLSGESAYYLNTDKSAELLKKYSAKVIFCQTIDGIYNIYAYTNKLDGHLVIDGKRINLHIAVTDNSTVIGSPIIFGGY